MKIFAFRLMPGVDLKQELRRIVDEHGLRAGYIITCAGSLSQARIRLPTGPGEPEGFKFLDEPTEIISLVGTLCPDGLHLHIGLSRRDGQCIGGHLVDGCVVRTTAELIVGDLPEVAFNRTQDAITGFFELRIAPRTEAE